MPLPPRDPRTGLFLKRGTRRNPDWTRTSTKASRAAVRKQFRVILVHGGKRTVFGPYATERGANVEAKSLLYAIKKGVRTSNIETIYGPINKVTGNYHEEGYRLMDKATGKAVATTTLQSTPPSLAKERFAHEWAGIKSAEAATKSTPKRAATKSKPRSKPRSKSKSSVNPRSNPKRDRKGRFVKRR